MLTFYAWEDRSPAYSWLSRALVPWPRSMDFSRAPGRSGWLRRSGRELQSSVGTKERAALQDSRKCEEIVLREQINDSVKSAMKAQDKLRLSTLRLVNSAIKYADIEAERAGKALSGDDILPLLQKMIKQRQESVDIYDKGGRKELADQERGEIEVIKGFLPQQMSEVETRDAIGAVIKEMGAQSIKDMGKVMAALKQAYAGRMDFGKASGLVKTLLTPSG